MPDQAGHPQIEKRRVVQAPLEGFERGGPVGADGHFVSQPRQLHLHEVAQVGLIVGKQDPQSSLTRLYPCLGPFLSPGWLWSTRLSDRYVSRSAD